MDKVEHTSDARVLAGIDISKHRHEVLISVPEKTRRRRLRDGEHIRLASFDPLPRLIRRFNSSSQ